MKAKKMDAQEIANRNKILEFRVGSYLYGTNTPTSDEDFSGVFVPDVEQLFGLEKIEQVDFSIKSKRGDGKNDKDAVDSVLYEFRKFIRLALANNPNIIEMLFVNTDNIIFSNEFGKLLLERAHLFPHIGLKERFLAYAFSQKHRMIIRTESYYALENALEWLNEYLFNHFRYGKTLLVEILNKKLPFFTVKGDNIKCGDLNFQKHFMLRKVKKMIEERLSKATNRKELLTKYGYDTKFASHLVRLMLEGKELLETGKLIYPLTYANIILDIKQGKLKMIEVLDYAESIEADIKNITIITSLPKKPRYDEIQKFTIDIIKYYHGYDNWNNLIHK